MRLIDADKLNRKKKYLFRVQGGAFPKSEYFIRAEDFFAAPTVDAVPVVRCKECDMWNEEDFSGRKSLGNYRCACAEWSNLEDGRRVYTGPDEFCSRGERKGGADHA